VSKHNNRNNVFILKDSESKRKKSKRKEVMAVDTQSWIEVDNIYKALGHSLVNVADNISMAISIIETNTETVDPEFVSTVKGLYKDLDVFSNDLVKINSRHKEFSGPINDGDELALCLSVFNDYSILSDKFRAVVFNPMLTISEYLANTQRDLKAIVKEETTDTIEE
jgi:hypothetical protein